MKRIEVLDLLRQKLIWISFPENQEIKFNDLILLKNNKDQIIGQVKSNPEESSKFSIDKEYFFERKILASEKKQLEESNQNQWDRVMVAREYVQKIGLSMYVFCSRMDFNKKVISFFFTSSKNVDFRELVKNLAGKFKKRIHLQRVTPFIRSEMVGGYDIGGREHENEFAQFFSERMTMNVVRDQGIIIKNNARIYDFSGRLKGCFLYEVDQYRENRKYLPHIKQKVTVHGKEGRIKGLDILNKKVKVSFSDFSFELFDIKEVEYENKMVDPRTSKEYHFPKIKIEEIGI